MILKPCVALLGASCISLPSLTPFGVRHLPPCSQSYTPSSRVPPGHRRRYATMQITGMKPSDNDVPAWPRTLHPTPYELLGISKDAVYNKRRFYQLVKLYHPDTHDSSSAHLSHKLSRDARLERYRLLVAANELLSDPGKRRLYDTQGIGWCHGRDHAFPSAAREADRNWRYQPGSAANNATWEDWERWRDGPPNEPLFMSNRMFASIAVVLIFICALAQVNRAEAAGEKSVDWMTEKTAAIGRELREDILAAEGCSRDERVEMFLRDRGNEAFKYEARKYDGPQRNRPS